ncbi:MAG: TlyA family RNA methyltransferase [Pseudomonadota bacterium]
MTVSAKSKIRLDQLLVDQDHFASRSRARDAISRGCVAVDGTLVEKPGANVTPSQQIEIHDNAQAYVSRAALKLIAGLEASGYSPEGRTCLDVGASTGGFTQVLLERGAIHVLALDVGHGQLAEPLQNDPRVTNLEKINARTLTRNHLGGGRPDFIVSDVSFISLKLALPPALELAEPESAAVLLVKPQFEVGRQAIGKQGLVSDDAAQNCAEDLRNWLREQPGWRSTHLVPSPIKGGDGNQEYLLCGLKDGTQV